MESLFYPQVQFILKKGTGIKACLFDNESKQMISNLIPLSVFRENDFFYFDYLTNKNRTKIDGMSCVVILRPTSLKMLLEEIVSPYYSNYIVLFTTQIDPFVLEIMANTDIYSVISEVHELNLDLYRQSTNLYTTNSKNYKRNTDGLFSMLLSLEISPSFLSFNIENNTDKILDLGKDLFNKITPYSFQKKGTVILLNRNFDLITPLLYDWHYYSMINEHFNIENSIVKIDKKDYLLGDLFFNSNKFKQINDVGEEIKIFVKNVEKNKNSFDDFEEIQEMLAQKNAAEMHLGIYNQILNEAIKIQEFSELEYKVLINKEINIMKAIEGMTDEKAVFKILLIYFLKYVKNWEEYSKNFPNYRNDLLKFYDTYKAQYNYYKNGFNTEIDIKLGYISPLKRILKHLLSNKIKDDLYVKLGSSETYGPIIIYIEGGVTIKEYIDVIEFSNSNNIEVFLIGNEILKTNSLTESNKNI